MSIIDDKFNYLSKAPSDINEHFPVLKKYASQSENIVEMGVRWVVSTWALLAGRPKKLTSIDIYHPTKYGGTLDDVVKSCKEENIIFEFKQASTLEIEIEETDLLFIDTDHTYKQLSMELALHSNKVKKFIIMHDTVTFKYELVPAIFEFLKKNSQWSILEDLNNNNGLTVLSRQK